MVNGLLKSPPALPPQRHHLAAVGDNRRSGDEAAGIGDEEKERPVEIARLAEMKMKSLTAPA
jgi:hypothetical protein